MSALPHVDSDVMPGDLAKRWRQLMSRALDPADAGVGASTRANVPGFPLKQASLICLGMNMKRTGAAAGRRGDWAPFA